jgi:hypothetical protein
MSRWLGALVAVVIGLGGSAKPVAAANIYASYMSLPYYEIVALAGGRLGTQNGVYAGQQILTVNDGSGYNALGIYTLDAWCVDFAHDIYIGANSINYTLSSLTNDHLGATPAASHPLSTAMAQELAGLAVYGNQLMRAAPSNLISAAVQVAIWNVEYGSVYAGPDTALAAEVSYLMSVAPSLSSTTGAMLESFDPSGTLYQSQSLLFSRADVPGPGPSSLAVPEPWPMPVLGVGFLGLMLAWRYGNRRITWQRRLRTGE